MADTPSITPSNLRSQAERLITQRKDEPTTPTQEEINRVFHELQVHQIELELQNEELRRAMDQLDQSRQQFFTLFDQAPVGYLVLDEVGMIRQVNNTFCNMVSRTRDALLNLPVWELIDTPDREIFLARFRAFFRNPAGKSLDARFGRPDLVEFYARLHGVRIARLPGRLSDSGQTQLLLTVSDVTELKRAEKAVQLSEERYRRLTENAQDIIYRYDFLPTPHFSYVSPAAAQITGYTPEEHYADPQLGYKLVHPDDHHLLQGASQGGVTPAAPLVLRWLRKDGKVIWTEQRNVQIFDDHGQLIALEGIARDITARKEAEDALQASLAENKMLFRELQHRTKNSMAMITGLVTLEAHNASDPQAVKALTNVRDRISTLSELYRLLFHSGSSQKVRLDTYFNELIESLKYAYARGAGHIEIKVALSEVEADEKTAAALGLILNELVTNALKYAFADGSTGQISIVLKQEGQQVCLFVEDDGAGLPDGFNLTNSHGMGMQLVSMLTEQVSGTLTYSQRAPTRFMIEFALP